MNKSLFIGRVGQDAELRYTSSGTPVATFSLALDNGKDKEGEKKNPTWVKVTIWEKKAEALAQYITKGKCVAVIGPVSSEAWIDKQSGEAKSKVVITCYEFEFCGGGNKEENGRDSGGQAPRGQRQQESDEEALRRTQIQDEDIPF